MITIACIYDDYDKKWELNVSRPVDGSYLVVVEKINILSDIVLDTTVIYEGDDIDAMLVEIESVYRNEFSYLLEDIDDADDIDDYMRNLVNYVRDNI